MSTLTAKIIGLMIYIMFISCNTSPPPPESDSDKQAVRQQLTDIHKEIKALRGEVAQLRGAVTEIHRGVVTPTVVAEPTVVPPPPVPIQVSLDDDPILGNRAAQVGIVEFSDYQCPFCVRFHTQTFPKLKEAYIDTDKVQYIFRDFPLDFHLQAKEAAIAANCAGEQDAYWKMHHDLFTNQRRLGPDLYVELAKTLKMDLENFLDCMKEADLVNEVDNDLTYGQSLGVRGTPSFFVGRVQEGQLVDAKKIIGAQPFPVFVEAIEASLNADQTSEGNVKPSQGVGQESQLSNLDNFEQLRNLFQSDIDTVRLIALLSPN